MPVVPPAFPINAIVKNQKLKPLKVKSYLKYIQLKVETFLDDLSPVHVHKVFLGEKYNLKYSLSVCEDKFMLN